MVVQGDVPVAKVLGLKFCSLLPLRVKKCANSLLLRVVKMDMISFGRFKRVWRTELLLVGLCNDRNQLVMQSPRVIQTYLNKSQLISDQ